MYYSSVYQDIIERGIARGAKEATIENILELLEVRFGASSLETLKPTFEAVEDPQRLKQLLCAAAQADTLEVFLATLVTNGNTS